MIEERLPRGQLVVATAGVMLALLLASLDQTIVGTAMPRIVAELHGLEYYAWVTTGYLVSSTVVVPVAGKLGDMFGRKPFLLAGMIGFVGASALCGLSQDMLQLVLFRGLQGLFGGMLFASVFTVLADIFPLEQRTRMQGLFGAVFGVSSVIGPTIGGFLTDGPGWRWVFYVNVPLGALAVTLVLAALPFVRSRASLRDIDWMGSAVLAAGVVPLLVALSITNEHAWTSPEVSGLLAVALVALVSFFLVEQRVAHPIIPFELFRNNAFRVSVLVGFFSAVGMFGTMVFVPLLYQGVLGVSATNSGQLLTPMMLGLILASTTAGFVMTRVRYYRFLGTLGIGVMIAGLVLLSRTGVSTNPLMVTLDIVTIGIGLGLTFPLTISVVQSALPLRYLGVGTSQIQFWRNLGGTVGTALLGSILARRLPDAMRDEVARLELPPQFQQAASTLTAGGSPQALFDPSQIAQARAALPPQAAPLFDQVLQATRVALASTLHDLFLIAAAILVVALVATFFLREVPLTTARRRLDQAPAREAEGAAV